MGCLDENTVAAFVDGLLAPPAAATIEQHVDGCVACRRLLANLAGALAHSRSRPADAEALDHRRLDDWLPPGVSVGRYVVLSQVAAGAMGVVYAAFDPQLDRRVALKLLRASIREDGDPGDTRLLREAQAMARLSHPNVVRVYDVGTIGGDVFVAMEFLEGTLAKWLRSGPHPWPRLLEKFVLAGRGLEAAHLAGLVHRDFKPDNVLLGDDGRVCVADFGLVRSTGPSVGPTPPGGTETPAFATASGVIVGTPAYMAPEQHAGQVADARSDQYSFAVALYEAIFDQHPFPVEDRETLRRAAQEGHVRPPPEGSPVPTWVRDVLLVALSAAPGDRFPSMGALLACLADDPSRRRRRWLGATAAMAALGVTAIAWATHHAPDPCESAGRELQGSWGATQRDLGRQAFLATKLPYAEASWSYVARTLDGYAAEWSRMRAATCAATRIHHEQSEEVFALRTACLDRRLDELQELSLVFTHADAQVVETSAAAVSSLSSLRDCVDAAALAGRMKQPDPAIAGRVEALRRQLARTKANLDAGRYVDARTSGERIVAEARALQYRPLIAEALWTLANARDHLSDDTTIDTMLDAIANAEAGRQDDVAALGWASLVRRYVAHADVAAATGALARARAAVDRLDGRTPARGDLLDNEGFLRLMSGQPGEAIRLYQTHVAELEGRANSEDLTMADTLEDLSRPLRFLERMKEAKAANARELTIRMSVLGPEHPRTADTMTSLGSDDVELGNLAEAETLLTRSLELIERTYGADHERSVWTLIALGELYDRSGRPEAGLSTIRRAEALLEGAGGKSPLLPYVLVALAEAMHRRERYSDALAAAARAEDLYRAFPGIAVFAVERARLMAGEALLGLHRFNEAKVVLERALDGEEHGEGPGAQQAETAFSLARTLWEVDSERPRARSLATQAEAEYAGAEAHDEDRRRVQAWLAAHRVP